MITKICLKVLLSHLSATLIKLSVRLTNTTQHNTHNLMPSATQCKHQHSQVCDS